MVKRQPGQELRQCGLRARAAGLPAQRRQSGVGKTHARQRRQRLRRQGAQPVKVRRHRPLGHVGGSQACQPGTGVGSKDGKRSAGAGQQFVTGTDGVVLDEMQDATRLLQLSGDPGVASDGGRLVVPGGKHRLGAEFGSQGRQGFVGPAVAADQRAAMLLQTGLQFTQRTMDEIHPAVGRRQTVKNGAVKHEYAHHFARLLQRRTEGGVIVQPQVAPQPAKRAGIRHGRPGPDRGKSSV